MSRRDIMQLIHDEEQSLLAVVDAWRRFDWDRFLLRWCALFHAAVAFTLASAPLDQILTRSTMPVLGLASRYVWAGLFLLAAIATWGLLHHRSMPFMLATLFGVLLVGGVWVTAFLIAALRGEGSALAVITWPFLYVPWLIVGARLASRER